MDDNNTESSSRRLGGIFLIIGWLGAIILVGLLIGHSFLGTKPPDITETAAGKKITIYRDQDSHFRVKGSINDVPVTFLIDTGATSVAVSNGIAKQANLKKKSEMITETANGNSIGYFTTIDKLSIAGIDINKVSAIIIPNMDDEQVLLGMNVLKKFIIQQTQDTLELTVPHSNR